MSIQLEPLIGNLNFFMITEVHRKRHIIMQLRRMSFTYNILLCPLDTIENSILCNQM